MLTIGEFSRLSRVTPRMLRHYDAIGLLRPDAVGGNGYRYYRQEQLSSLVRIQWLKGCGFSLQEIGPLLALEDSQLLPYLRQRRLTLCQELLERQALLRRLDLPEHLTANGLLEALNLLYDRRELEALLRDWEEGR